MFGLLAMTAVLGLGGGEHTHEGHEDSSTFAPDVHMHPEGEENHGTEWFFSQPWASRERWRYLARDSALLSGMACGILLISGARRRK